MSCFWSRDIVMVWLRLMVKTLARMFPRHSVILSFFSQGDAFGMQKKNKLDCQMKEEVGWHHTWTCFMYGAWSCLGTYGNLQFLLVWYTIGEESYKSYSKNSILILAIINCLLLFDFIFFLKLFTLLSLFPGRHGSDNRDDLRMESQFHFWGPKAWFSNPNEGYSVF